MSQNCFLRRYNFISSAYKPLFISFERHPVEWLRSVSAPLHSALKCDLMSLWNNVVFVGSPKASKQGLCHIQYHYTTEGT